MHCAVITYLLEETGIFRAVVCCVKVSFFVQRPFAEEREARGGRRPESRKTKDGETAAGAGYGAFSLASTETHGEATYCRHTVRGNAVERPSIFSRGFVMGIKRKKEPVS